MTVITLSMSVKHKAKQRSGRRYRPSDVVQRVFFLTLNILRGKADIFFFMSALYIHSDIDIGPQLNVGFLLPTGKVDRWVRINIVRKVISQLL